MTIQRHIDIALTHHKAGNTAAAVRYLEGLIRAGIGTKKAQAALAAITNK